MSDDRLLIDELWGDKPRPVDGFNDGDEFYFRSRWSDWDVAVSNDPAVDPSDGHHDRLAFYREGEYGDGPYGASYMPLHIAEFIIRWCSRDYLIEKRDRI